MKREKIKKLNKLNKLIFFNFIVLSILTLVFLTQRKKINEITSQSIEVENLNKELSQEIEYLKKDLKRVNKKDFIEKKAREEYGMIKPGEKIYIDSDKDKN